MGKAIEHTWIRKTSPGLRALQLANEIWIRSADHHTGQRLLNAVSKGLTEDRARSLTHTVRNLLHHRRQPQKA
ncbi:hypothetical protein SPHINGO391_10013 [Sphingomonas aurantiaca]|uniref:Uncharacterized protein n=1 Tax=Sphingomonas aurantiaca TaxID=185949 RepID=A0A5E7XTF6_9SPHN|nr:hypothetical protein SPHINGO391_10013 [Sphingomonas aurantiaca]